jgi:hypothetical protein
MAIGPTLPQLSIAEVYTFSMGRKEEEVTDNLKDAQAGTQGLRHERLMMRRILVAFRKRQSADKLRGKNLPVALARAPSLTNDLTLEWGIFVKNPAPMPNNP